MDVLVTGAHGTVGTAVVDHLGDDHDLTLLDQRDNPDRETVVADVGDYGAIRPAFDGRDAVVHLAGYPTTDGSWEEVHENNVVGTHNALEAAADAGVETFVFASSNHVVGMYEEEHAPECYFGTDLEVDHASTVRPDSEYGASKAAGEDFGRKFAERQGLRFYALRIGSVRDPEYDHPFGDAERGVDEGRWERGSDAYEEQVARFRCTWLSRRDCAHLVDCCLRDDSVRHDVFYGISDNPRSWFDIDHARETIGYAPRDSGEEYDESPS